MNECLSMFLGYQCLSMCVNVLHKSLNKNHTTCWFINVLSIHLMLWTPRAAAPAPAARPRHERRVKVHPDLFKGRTVGLQAARRAGGSPKMDGLWVHNMENPMKILVYTIRMAKLSCHRDWCFLIFSPLFAGVLSSIRPVKSWFSPAFLRLCAWREQQEGTQLQSASSAADRGRGYYLDMLCHVISSANACQIVYNTVFIVVYIHNMDRWYTSYRATVKGKYLDRNIRAEWNHIFTPEIQAPNLTPASARRVPPKNLKVYDWWPFSSWIRWPFGGHSTWWTASNLETTLFNLIQARASKSQKAA